MEIISRKDALAAGLSHYFTGKPCKYGHIAKRNKYCQCMECNRLKINTGQYRDGKSEYNKKFRKQHPDRIRAQERSYRTPEQNAEYCKRFREKNPDYRSPCENTPERKAKKSISSSSRRSRVRERTPPWADLDAIHFFYECRPEGCHVDHIIPLYGEKVSGFHVETNLQWLPIKDNLRKGNKF